MKIGYPSFQHRHQSDVSSSIPAWLTYLAVLSVYALFILIGLLIYKFGIPEEGDALRIIKDEYDARRSGKFISDYSSVWKQFWRLFLFSSTVGGPVRGQGVGDWGKEYCAVPRLDHYGWNTIRVHRIVFFFQAEHEEWRTEITADVLE